MTLGQYLKASEQTQRDFARAVGVSASYMNELVQGSKTPSLSVASKIEKITAGAVPISAFIGRAQRGEAEEKGAA